MYVILTSVSLFAQYTMGKKQSKLVLIINAEQSNLLRVYYMTQ